MYYKEKNPNAKFYYIIAFLSLIIVVLICNQFKDCFFRKHYGKKIATIDGKTIYESDIEKRLSLFGTNGKKIDPEDLPEEFLKAIISEKYINDKILKESRKLGYFKDKDLNKAIEDFRNDLIKEKFFEEKVYKKISDDDVIEEYAKMIEELKGQEERKIKHILVKDEDDIKRIRRGIIRSGNFEKFAKEYSEDSASAVSGGDLGYVLKSDLVPEFGEIAFILKVGEVSKPVKTQYGWHLIKVEDARPVKILTLEESKESLKQRMQQDKIQQFLQDTMKDKKINILIKLKRLEKNKKNLQEEDEK